MLHAGYPPAALFFLEAVELRLRKIGESLANNIVTATQSAVLSFQRLQTLASDIDKCAITATGFPLMLTKPGTKGLRGAANLRGDGAEGCPLEVVVLTFQNHTGSPLTDLRGKPSIFSHPVYLSLREFSLQDCSGDSDSRGGNISVSADNLRQQRIDDSRYVLRQMINEEMIGRNGMQTDLRVGKARPNLHIRP